MNRTQYSQARRLLRDNGDFAYRWMNSQDAQTMRGVLSLPKDRYGDVSFLKESGMYSPGCVWLRARYRLLGRI